MLKSTFSVYLFLIIALFVACNKDDDNLNPIPIEIKYLNKVQQDSSTTYKFQYKAGRLDQIFLQENPSSGAFNIATYHYNEMGQVSEIRQEPSLPSAASYLRNYYLNYNTSNQLINYTKVVWVGEDTFSLKKVHLGYHSEGYINQVVDTTIRMNADTITSLTIERDRYTNGNLISKERERIMSGMLFSYHCYSGWTYDNQKSPYADITHSLLIATDFSTNNRLDNRGTSKCTEPQQDPLFYYEITYDESNYPVQQAYFEEGGLLTTTWYEYIE